MTEADIAELRSRIAEVDIEFGRRANILLDDILITRDQADKNTKAIEDLANATLESRRDIDQLAQRTGELAQEISNLRREVSEVTKNVQLVAFTVSQTSESMTILRETQRDITNRFVEAFTQFQEQAAVDRAQTLENQAEIRRIWEYLLSTRPNGRGEQGGMG